MDGQQTERRTLIEEQDREYRECSKIDAKNEEIARTKSSDEAVRKKRLEYFEQKEQKEPEKKLLECWICYNDIPDGESIQCQSSHHCCSDCFVDYYVLGENGLSNENAISRGENGSLQIRCRFPNCQHHLPLELHQMEEKVEKTDLINFLIKYCSLSVDLRETLAHQTQDGLSGDLNLCITAIRQHAAYSDITPCPTCNQPTQPDPIACRCITCTNCERTFKNLHGQGAHFREKFCFLCGKVFETERQCAAHIMWYRLLGGHGQYSSYVQHTNTTFIKERRKWLQNNMCNMLLLFQRDIRRQALETVRNDPTLTEGRLFRIDNAFIYKCVHANVPTGPLYEKFLGQAGVLSVGVLVGGTLRNIGTETTKTVTKIKPSLLQRLLGKHTQHVVSVTTRTSVNSIVRVFAAVSAGLSVGFEGIRWFQQDKFDRRLSRDKQCTQEQFVRRKSINKHEAAWNLLFISGGVAAILIFPPSALAIGGAEIALHIVNFGVAEKQRKSQFA
tara:strand:- start:436 stop:1941 length:1506 start_codon:yes stop_codon:yes gene_type:complete